MPFSDHPASFRSDVRVEAEADTVRAWGNLDGSAQFNVVDLIEGPLRKNLPFTLGINFFDKRRDKVPAYVTFIRGRDHAELYVERRVWKLAELNYNVSRFILCHEIGHLKMHRNDALGFARPETSRLFNMQPEELAEAQANKFADSLLAPNAMLENLLSFEEIMIKFNVPEDCAKRRFERIEEVRRDRLPKSYAGEACTHCFNFTLIRIGTYCKCDNCGKRSGPF